eukprot:1004180-Prymnesium_polylepis.1
MLALSPGTEEPAGVAGVRPPRPRSGSSQEGTVPHRDRPALIPWSVGDRRSWRRILPGTSSTTFSTLVTHVVHGALTCTRA